MSKCLYVFYNFSTQQSYKLDWFFISFYVFFLLYGQKNAIYAITYRLFSELIKCPFSATQPHRKFGRKKGISKVVGLGVQRFNLKPAFCTVDITSCSVMPSDFTVSTLSLLAVSTSQWQIPLPCPSAVLQMRYNRRN
jgi:hypothetical protein